MFHQLLFKQLQHNRWGILHLDLMSRLCFPEALYKENPCLDPLQCQEWINALHRAIAMHHTYGGLYESREHLWRGHYHDPRKMIHLGIDYNVPEGTLVSCPIDGKVSHVMHDHDPIGGWGGRIIIRSEHSNNYLLLAHLDEEGLPLRMEGQPIKKGDPLGIVAKPERNGGWYPHLHAQGINADMVRDPDGYFEALDGYDGWNPEMHSLYPHPGNII